MSTPPLPARSTDVMQPKDFNLWCALNSKPFRLVQNVWPDGSTEWDVEAFPGQPEATTAYGTGQSDPVAATQSAFAFAAGVEWGETLARDQSSDDAEDDDSDDDGDDDSDAPGSNDGSAGKEPGKAP